MKSLYTSRAAARRMAIVFVCAFQLTTNLSALDYYWVNGSGLWSNFATHWAKIPNPTLPSHFHANVPTADDDVYFTDNGGVPYTLTVDAGSTVPKCRSMDWTGVPGGTVWGGSGSRIDIYGSVVLEAGMVISYSGYVQMITLGPTHTIRSNGVHFPVEVIFTSTGGGGWQLLDDFYCDGRVNHEGGLIETNGHTVTIGDTFLGNYYAPNGELRLGSSDFIVLDGNAFFKYSSAQLDAGSSHIKMYGDSVSLEGTNHFSSPTHYNDVSFFGRCSPQKGFIWGNVDGTLTFHQFGLIGNYNTSAVIPVLNNVVFLGDGLISNVNSYNSLTFSPGRTYTVQDVAVINGQAPSNTDQIILPGGTLNVMGNGTCNGFITIRSWQAGTAFEIVNNSGADQTVHCVILEDVHAAGANALRANDYVDLGNCLNWVFLTPSTGFDLYWVGGPGDWDDPCHWTSNPIGVAGDCTCIPNGATNVFFTANSGFTPATNDVEQVRTPADGSYIAFMDMDWSGVTGNPTFISVFNGSSTSDQFIYGSVAYSPDMTLDFRGASRFRGKDVHTITSAGKAFRSNVFFEGTGEYQFLDNIIFDNFAYTPVFFVYHLRGTIRTLGNSIYLGANKNWFGNKNTSNNFVDQGAVLWLGEPGGNSSTVTFSGNAAFRAGYQPGNFHPVESHIIAYQNNGSPYVTAENRPHDFWDVSFYNGFTSGAGYFYGGILNKLTYHENTYAIIENSTPNRLIHELEMKDDGEIRGNQTFDIMTLTGGNVYRFQDGTVQTITSGGTLNTSSDCEKYVTLNTGFPEKTATLRKEGGGAIVVNNIILENVIGDVSTGATYSATNGILQGNTTGWTASLPPARTLYWVGGGGNWNDAAHWSLSSGGPGGECPPTPLDNVFFNAGSGLGPGNNVVLTQNWVYCKDMDWTDAGAGTILSGIGRSLHIFGSLTLSTAMTYSVSDTWFRAEQPATITSAGRKYGFVYFWSPNGDWTLLDAFETVPDVDIHHYYGIINSNNQTIGTGRIWWGVTQSPWFIQGYTPSPTAKLFLGSSKMRFYPTIWATRGVYNYAPSNFDAGTSEIIFESGIWAALNTPASHTLEFYDITFKWVNSNLETGIFKVKNKVLFEKNGTISAGTEIHEVEFRDDGVIFGSRPYHSIKFAPGKRYTFQSGTTQTIVPHNGIEGQFIAQGLPGQYIEMKSSDPNTPAIIHKDDYDGTSTCTKYLFLTGMTHTGTEDIYVPTPGGDVFNNTGWLFFPCNPCPATIPMLDPASITTGCPPGKAKLILAGLQPDEWANWYTDPDATTNLVYSGGLGGNLFEPDITGPTTYYARVFSDGGLCESTVVLSVDITVTTPPAAFNVTGGGTVCAGSNGAPVGLNGSAAGVSYQLLLDGGPVGAPLLGTGAALDFGLQTAAGTYTVVATPDGSACPLTMTGSADVTGDPNAAPAVAAASNAPLCAGGGDLLLSETGGAATSWAWTGPGGFASADQNPVIANAMPANSGLYTVVVSDGLGCTNVGTVGVVVHPQPTMPAPSDLLECAGAVVTLSFDTDDPFTFYTGTTNNTSIGIIGGAGLNPFEDTYVLVNSSTGPVTANLTVTPVRSYNSLTCTGTTHPFNVTVLPYPQADGLPDLAACAGEAVPLVPLSGPVPGAYYSWTNDNPAIGLAAAGNGDIPAFVAQNNGVVPVSALVEVRGFYDFNGLTCSDTVPVSFAISVYPVPSMAKPDDQVLCAGTSTDPVVFLGSLPDAVFEWTNDNPAIGLPAAGTGNIGAFVAQNNTGAPVTATITVVPKTTGDSDPPNILCINGIAVQLTAPSVSVSVPYDLLLSSASDNCTPFDKLEFSVVKSAANPASFPTDGLGDPFQSVSFTCSELGLQPVQLWVRDESGNADYCESLVLVLDVMGICGQSPRPELPEPTALPASSSATAAKGMSPASCRACTGNSVSFTITVNPVPSVSQPADLTVCADEPVSALNWSSDVPGTEYAWTNDNPAIGLPAAGTGPLPAFVAVNPGNSVLTSIIEVQGTFEHAGVTCADPLPKSFGISVRPRLPVTCPPNATVCIAGGPVALSGGLPAGGTYSGPGVSAGVFDPAAAGVGPHEIEYAYVAPAPYCANPCTFTIEVVAGVLPAITCPGPVTVPCAGSVPVPNPGLVGLSGGCGAANVAHLFTTPPYDVDCANRFKVTRYYQATDASNNTVSCSQVITVFDDTKPNFTFVPANVTVQCNSVPAVGVPVATDNCGGAVGIAYDGQAVSGQTCTDTYVLTRQWTATDACGNTRTATQRITVRDTQKPAFVSPPANITVQCDAIPAPAAPTATDNCDTDVAITYVGQTKTNGTCANAYTLTRRWVASDNCNNTVSVSQRITVVDNGKPALTIPPNQTIACTVAIPPVGTATATDGCGGNVTVAYLGQTTANATCPGNYQIRRTWRATDVCGNSTVATQTIQVADNQPPVFTSVPVSATISCTQSPPPLNNPVATDNCGGYVQITYLGQVRTDGDCPHNYDLTRTWRATDLCGNSTTAVQVISVRDTEAPAFTNPPADLTVLCAPNCVPPPATPSAIDNCSTPTVTLQETQSPGDCSTGYTVTRTWTAADACGNAVTHTQTYTVLPAQTFSPPTNDRAGQQLKTQNPKRITVQPNPTTDRFWIDLSAFRGAAVAIVIYGETGRLVWQSRIGAVEEQWLPVSLREAGAAAGLYTVSVRSASGTAVQRVVLVE